MTAAPPRRFTVEEYHRLAEAGVLGEDDRVELLDGIIVKMPPIGSFHGGSANRLTHVFEQINRARWITSVQNPLAILPRSEPQPDLLLLKPRKDFYSRSHPKPSEVFLVVEISDSTLLVDRADKLPIYARAGIREVWIVNLVDRVIETFAKPKGGRFTKTRIVQPGDELAPAAFPDALIDTAALLRSPA